jgi:hydroxymethylpyrimidine/phosphomethylpyrimidine kinase
LTAVTVQTDREVRSIAPVSADLIAAQIRAALATAPVGAIKIGMLGRRAAIGALLETLPPREQIPSVLDPVLVASSGGMLLDVEGQRALCRELLPRVTLLTPNIPEAAALLQEPIDVECDLPQERLEAQARALLRLGPQAVLLKGGHARGAQVIDILAVAGEALLLLTTPRVPRQRRGTGCSLASAIAAHLAGGCSLVQACRAAQAYVGLTLQRSF